MAQSHTVLSLLHQRLEAARQYDAAVRRHMTAGEPVHIRGTGKAISSAYEHFRNAAEYAEGHLALQRAIKRFYKRTLFIVKRKPEHIGHELLVELVLAGYIPDGSYGAQAAAAISQLATEHLAIYDQLRQTHVPYKQARGWVLAILSVRTRDLLSPHTYDLALVSFAYDYFLQHLPKEQLVRSAKDAAVYEDALYIAVHQMLLKSDPDVVRTDLLHAQGQTAADTNHYRAWNRHVEELYAAGLTLRLKRMMQKSGAPFHILRALAANNDALPDILPHRDQLLQAFNHQLSLEYRSTARRLNNGIIKSIIFLFLTKVTIGIAVEVPFDHAVYGHIILMPLAINLLFPPLYMASIRLGLAMPSAQSAQATTDFMDRLLYTEQQPPPMLPKRMTPYPLFARLLYSALALIPFAITVLLLERLHFNPLQMVIFFIFFSTASFLGFHLSNMIRDLTITTLDTRLFAIFRDLFYLPFIMLGQWLTSKYSKVNIVGEFLDLVIELPLKTVISMIRQSIRFLNEKHQELY